jgi:hypothetical protein
MFEKVLRNRNFYFMVDMIGLEAMEYLTGFIHAGAHEGVP